MTDPSILRGCVLDYSITNLSDRLKQIEKCLRLLSLEQVWHRPNEVSNSIGVLVIHLTGNVNQWINNALGGDEFERDRPAEFAQRDPLPTDEILINLQRVVARAAEVIRGLSIEKLTASVTVQGYEVSGVAAVIHVVEHFSLHTGQIISTTKLLTDKDLSEYDAHGHRIDGRTTDVP